MKAAGFSLTIKARSETMKEKYFEKEDHFKKESQHFYAAMYLRLSREDSDSGANADSCLLYTSSPALP